MKRLWSTFAALAVLALQPVVAADAPRFTVSADGKEFAFRTSALCGSLHQQGKSLGLMPVVDVPSTTQISGAYGVFSHYRLLDAETRYGHAAWDWASRAKLLPDGAAEVAWTADAEHPFDLRATYRWKSDNTLDLETAVTARKDLRRFEVFLASYFSGMTTAAAYVKDAPGGGTGLLEAKRSAGYWQMFPRDDDAVNLIQDGRWKRPPNPVDWTIMPRLAGGLAVRRAAATGLTAVLMVPPPDVFAISMPYGEEGHGSIYLSLLGRDIAAGQTAAARSRLVVGKFTDREAIALYEDYCRGGAAPAK